MSVKAGVKHKWVFSLPYTILGLIALVMMLTGCLHETTKLNQNRLQVQEERFSQSFPSASDLSGSAVRELATHYDKHGEGPFELTVMYDPGSKSAGAMRAGDEAVRIVREMRQAGVQNVDVKILPVGEIEGTRAMVSYTAYNALPPQDCTMISGYDDLNIEAEESYKLGCSTETLFARQIARPKDLKGQAPGGERSDGRRLGNGVEVYRTGIPNEPLVGQSATGG